LILNESKIRIEDTRHIENFNFLVFSTQNIFLYDLRFPHFPVSEIPLNINYKGLEIKEIEAFGETYLDTNFLFCGIDITYKDNSCLLFDIEICNEVLLRNEKYEQENDNFEVIEEVNENLEYIVNRKETENCDSDYLNNNENIEISSNTLDNDKKFGFSLNNNTKIKRESFGSAIEIDEDSSYNLSDNRKNFNYLMLKNFNNLKTTERKKGNNYNDISKGSFNKNNLNFINFNENKNQFIEFSDKEQEDSESVFNNTSNNLIKNNIESFSNENDSMKEDKIKCDFINENVNNLNNAFRNSLNIENKKKIDYEIFFKDKKQGILKSDFFMDFCDLNLIRTNRDIHDMAGFLYIKGNSDLNDFNHLKEIHNIEEIDNNLIYEKLFLKEDKKANKSKYFINFAIDYFSGINCYINKIINTNNFSNLSKKSYDFKKIKNVFLENKYNDVSNNSVADTENFPLRGNKDI